MTKKELIKAIKTCKRAYAYCAGMTDDDGWHIQIVKADALQLLKTDHIIKKWKIDKFRAVLTKDNDLLIG